MKIVPILLSLLLAISLVPGCGTKIKGGQTSRDTGALDVQGGQQTKNANVSEIVLPTPNGPLVYRYGFHSEATTQPSSQESHDRRATTQSSVDAAPGQVPQVGDADEGEIAGMKFKVAGYSAFKNAWWLGLIFIVAGGLFVWQGRIAYGVMLGLTGVITCLAPLFAVIGAAVLLIGLAVYWFVGEHEKATLKASAGKISEAMDTAVSILPLDMKEKVRSIMNEKLDRKEKVVASTLRNS